MAREIAIGDIHGCALALRALLEAIQPAPGDTIITLGDTIDCGPDSRGVLEQLIALGERCTHIALKGNHEEMLLAACEGTELRFWLRFGGVQTLASYGVDHPQLLPREHLDFLRHGRRFHETATHLFVHANYWPNRPMEEQPGNVLFWEHLDPREAARHYSGKTAIVGHTSQKNGEVLDLGFLQCIDTFCHGGGWLTALEVHTGQVWQANQAGELRGAWAQRQHGKLRPGAYPPPRHSRRQPAVPCAGGRRGTAS